MYFKPIYNYITYRNVWKREEKKPKNNLQNDICNVPAVTEKHCFSQSEYLPKFDRFPIVPYPDKTKKNFLALFTLVSQRKHLH